MNTNTKKAAAAPKLDQTPVRVRNIANGMFMGIPMNKTGSVPRWVATKNPSHVEVLGDPPQPAGDDETETENGPTLAELKAQIRESLDLEWVAEQTGDPRKSVAELAEIRLAELLEV